MNNNSMQSIIYMHQSIIGHQTHRLTIIVKKKRFFSFLYRLNEQ